MNRLRNTTCYLVGSIDDSPDGGQRWRRQITPVLQSMGVKVIDPTNKPSLTISEDKDFVQKLRRLKEQGKYDEVATLMKPIRALDLRCVDKSDFIIAYLNLDVVMCGSWEEIFLCNRQRKPVIVICESGKGKLPSWLYGTLPHDLFFDDFKKAQDYLAHINEAKTIDDCDGRWQFFDHLKMTGVNDV